MPVPHKSFVNFKVLEMTAANFVVLTMLALLFALQGDADFIKQVSYSYNIHVYKRNINFCIKINYVLDLHTYYVYVLDDLYNSK